MSIYVNELATLNTEQRTRVFKHARRFQQRHKRPVFILNMSVDGKGEFQLLQLLRAKRVYTPRSEQQRLRRWMNKPVEGIVIKVST